MHGVSLVVGAVALALITVADLLVVRKLPRSGRLPSLFLSYVVFMSIVAGVAVGFLSQGH
jgi:hypothetical protein